MPRGEHIFEWERGIPIDDENNPEITAEYDNNNIEIEKDFLEIDNNTSVQERNEINNDHAVEINTNDEENDENLQTHEDYDDDVGGI